MMDDVIDVIIIVVFSLGLLFLDVFLVDDFLSFPPMMIIIAVLSSQSLDDPFHILTTTTHDEDVS